jgi:threonine dehydrogenase-like Zn-dependent dehydrogenase
MSLEVDAFLLDADLAMSVGRRTLPDPGPGEALVRVEWAGVCGSDLHVMRTGAWVREFPATLGHEIYGHVVRGGDGVALAPGTAVVADSRVPCGRCEACAVDPARCPNLAFVGEALPGGFATHCVLPVTGLHAVADTLDGATAVLAEPLAVVLHGLAQLDAAPRHVAILGHGPIGALVHIELRRRAPDAQIDVAEPVTLRADLARALGARTVAAAGALDGTYDVVIDAAGYASSLPDAIEIAAPAAQLLLLAISHHEAAVRPIDIVEKRLRIVGANAFVDELPDAIALLATDGWRYAPIVTEAIALDELPAVARRQLAAPEAIKVLVRP